MGVRLHCLVCEFFLILKIDLFLQNFVFCFYLANELEAKASETLVSTQRLQVIIENNGQRCYRT